MAARMFWTFPQNVCRQCVGLRAARLFSSDTGSRLPTGTFSNDETLKPMSAVTRNGEMVMMWHPKQPFPYECSKPMPTAMESLRKEDSVLKVQHVRDEEERKRPTGPTDDELSEMFGVHVVKFKPSVQWKKKRHIVPDREAV